MHTENCEEVVLTPPHSQQQSTLYQETDNDTNDENNHQRERSSAPGSDKELASAVNPCRFRKISLHDMSESEKENTIAVLEDNIAMIGKEFARLLSTTCKSMQGRVSTDELAACVLALKAFPIESGKNDSVFKEQNNKIMKAKTVPKIFQILSSYWFFLDYEVLTFIIEEYGSEDDQTNLQTYDQKLNGFCLNHVFEVPQPHDGDEHSKQTKLYFKLNLTRVNLNCEALRRIKRKLAKILNVMPYTLHLRRVEKGCVRLTILIPKFVALELFPLSEDQKVELSKASVLKLECENCVEFQVLLFFF